MRDTPIDSWDYVSLWEKRCDDTQVESERLRLLLGDSHASEARLIAERDRLHAGIDSVLALHVPDAFKRCSICLETEEWGVTYMEDWPCPTVRALTGDDQ